MSQFKKGWKGKTRCGYYAEIFADDFKGRNLTLCGRITEADGLQAAATWTADGSFYHSGVESEYDLIPSKRTVYVNLLNPDPSGQTEAYYYSEDKEARRCASRDGEHLYIAIAVPVEIDS